MWITIGIIIGLVIGGWLGYQACMAKYRPTELLKLAKIQTEMISGEITPEKALKEIHQIEIEHPELKKK